MALRFFLAVMMCVAFASFTAQAQAQAQEDEDEEQVHVEIRAGSGLQISSPDRRYGLRLSGIVQLWGTGSEQFAGPGRSAGVTGARMRRAWFTLGGHFFGEDNRFTVQFALERIESRPLVDAFFSFHQLRDLNVYAGLMLEPFLRTWIAGAANLSFAERSHASREWFVGRRFGIQLGSDDLFGLGRIRYRAGLFVGPQSGRSTMFAANLGARVDIAVLGRPELFVESDLTRSPTPRLSVGGAYGLLLDENLIGLQTADEHRVSGDLLFRIYGLSAEGTFLYRDSDAGTATAGIGSLSYLLPWFDLEAAVRYSRTERTHALGVASGQTQSLAQEWTATMSYYFFGEHAFKLQATFMITEDDLINPGLGGLGGRGGAAVGPGYSGILSISAQL